MKDLHDYHKKRDPAATPEPFTGKRQTGGSIFVIHKHSARQLHYDLRLEVNGSLWSWAVPKGPSPDPVDKRLAVHVEAHPVDYAFWEGTIPEDNYGAGAMIIWDRGQWIALDDPVEGLKKGKLLFELRGFKLRGKWTLVQTKRAAGKDWLLIKEQDGWVGRIPEPAQDSVISGLTVEQLKSGAQPATDLRQQLSRCRAKSSQTLPTVKPMLCEKSEPFDHAGWLFEIKYDGYRVLIEKNGQRIALRSRNGNDLASNFPEITETIAALPYDQLLLDGEIVCLGVDGLPSFQRLQQRAQLQRSVDVQHAVVALPASFFAFDLLHAEDFDLRNIALTKRKQFLRSILPSVGTLRYVDHFEQHGKRVYEHAVAMRLEGLVAKKIDSTYQPRRSSDWLKIVALRTDEFVVIGYVPPKPSDRYFKSLLLAQFDRNDTLHYLGRAGSGLSGAQRATIATRFGELSRPRPAANNIDDAPKESIWLAPELVVEIRYKNITQAGNLRQPVLLRVRDDKPPTECKLFDDEHVLSVPAAVKPSKAPPKVIFGNQEKVFWPASDLLNKPVTKGDLLKHYERVAKWMLPWLKDRPVVLTRYPDGIDGKSFFQHQAPGFLPSWIRTETITKSDGDRIDYIIIDDADSLLYIANLGTIPIHIWSASASDLEHPDYCILDLDPKGAPMADIATIAKALHQICNNIGLTNVIKTSGGSGLHILIPLARQLDHEQAATLAELLARVVVKQLPAIATIQRSIDLREGRVYIDYLQNGFGKTIAAPFCARPQPGAPVSTPLRWHEVRAALKPTQYSVLNAARRMNRLQQDPTASALGGQLNMTEVLAYLANMIDG